MASRAATGRAIAIIVGLVLALVAAFLLWRYVSAADQRAQEGAELVDIWVADGPITAGTTGQNAIRSQQIVPEQIANSSRPTNAITSLNEIVDLTALSTIPDQAIIQDGLFGESTIADTQFKLNEGQVAITLQVGIPEGVGGFLNQGDTVGIISHIDAQVATTQIVNGPDGPIVASTEAAEVEVTTSKYLASAEILSLGQRIITTDAEGNQDDALQQTGQVLVTLSVTPEVAEQLVFANNEGIMHFTLLPEGGELGDTPGTTFDTLFNR